MSSDAAIGMMDGAYFTSRSEILDFFNTLLDLKLTKIEQTASGAVACQLTEYIFPGSIPMKRVKWDTKNSYEYVQNYKLLQAAFTKNKVQKYVDVDKLIRGKYQDNLEFCQWLKAFHDQQQMLGIQRENYDPVEARSKASSAPKSNQDRVARSNSCPERSFPTTKNTVRKPSPARAPRIPNSSALNKAKTNNGSSRSVTSSSSTNSTIKQQKKNTKDPSAIMADANLIKKNAELASQNAELELTMAEIEKERNFYFEKLRDVEVLLQVHEEKKIQCEESDYESLIKRILHVLYATSEDKVVVDDNGEILSILEHD